MYDESRMSFYVVDETAHLIDASELIITIFFVVKTILRIMYTTYTL